MARILMVTSVFPRWEGDATPPFVRNLAVALAEKGWEITVVAPHGPGARFSETVGAVRVIRFPYMFPLGMQKLCYDGGMLVNFRTRPWTHTLLPLFVVAQIITLLWVAIRRRSDVIHSHSLLPQGFSADLVATVLRLPHITTSHGNDVFGLPSDRLMGRLKRRVLRRATAVTVNSSATEEAVLALGCNSEKIHRIPAMPTAAPPRDETVERIRCEVISEAGPALAFVGRIIEDKGVGDLIEAVKFLVNDFPDIRCLLVGDGQDRPRYEQKAIRVGVDQHLHWAGWVPPNEVSAWMAAADVIVVPSRESPGGWTEAQGLVVVEAMLTGTPVVATRVGGIPDMIEEGVTGRLADPGDPRVLAETIASVLRDPKTALALARTARGRAESTFGPEAVAAATAALYAEVSAK